MTGNGGKAVSSGIELHALEKSFHTPQGVVRARDRGDDARPPAHGRRVGGLVPFSGIAIGHVVSSESIGPALGGTTAAFALLGGVWFPIRSGAMHVVAPTLPSLWLVQASHVAIGGDAWSGRGWLVVAAWSVGLGVLAARAYRRGTGRV